MQSHSITFWFKKKVSNDLVSARGTIVLDRRKVGCYLLIRTFSSRILVKRNAVVIWETIKHFIYLHFLHIYLIKILDGLNFLRNIKLLQKNYYVVFYKYIQASIYNLLCPLNKLSYINTDGFEQCYLNISPTTTFELDFS